MKDELDVSYHVVRGGSWDDRPSDARVALRFHFAPGYRDNSLGVRLFRMIQPLQQLGEVNNGK